jgi:hypothetical protein
VFVPFNLDDDLMKMSGVGVHAKKIYCCVEHVTRYKKFKEVKEKLKKISNGGDSLNITVTDLEQLLNDINNLCRFDLQMKKLFSTQNTLGIENFDIVYFLLTLLNQFDLKIDILVLTNISNFIKEIDLCKRYSTSEFFNKLLSYLSNMNFNLYSGKYITTNTMTIKEEVLCFLTLINIFNNLYSNSKDKVLEIDSTNNLVVMLFNLLVTITDNRDIKDKIINQLKNKNTSIDIDNNYLTLIHNYECLIMNSLFSLMYMAYVSKNVNVDFILFVNNFIVEKSNNIFQFIIKKIQQVNDINLVKNFIIFYCEVLTNLYYTKIEYLPEQCENFIISYEEFLNVGSELQNNEFYKKQLKEFYFVDKSLNIANMIKEKLHYKNSSEKNINIID